MTTTPTYPSAQFPGPPSVSVDIPEGWSPVQVPGTLLAARRTDTEGRFAPHVVVRGVTRSSNFTVGRALGELTSWSYVDDRADGQTDAPFAIEIDAVPIVGVNLSWRDNRTRAGHSSLQALMQTVRVTP